MREINWKSLSLSLIISTILNGTALSILLNQYMYAEALLWNEVLPHILNRNASGQNAYTIVYGKALFPYWIWFLIFPLSYIFVTMISYFLIELRNRRKK